ncbi:MBL fold metallo-hydrolase [Mesorhizobium sp. M0244]|uniref:MBL fold metallo-hydrolase n=1 Tax=Mesorhizobium sp. M0244 TaxID=2956926 RepID=UPI003337E778
MCWHTTIIQIDHVVATHNDGDHALGLVAVLEHFDPGVLWMLRPWMYADELIGYPPCCRTRCPTIARDLSP